MIENIADEKFYSEKTSLEARFSLSRMRADL